ncbi:MAG: alpha/beta fold hydrolase [Planctomycetia bacterium]|nr:alpha/beta fold hydrolase [Planctomycetia bacterium]
MADTKTEPIWLPAWLTRVALASSVGYWAAAWTVSRWLTRPTPGAPERTPGDHGLCWQPLECRTEDGFRLHGWVVTPDRPRGTVVLFHGLRHNRAQTLERTLFLTGAGYRCVAFDHRAHGESTGKRSSFGYFESRDVLAVLGLVERCWPHAPKAVLGLSMGGAAVCYAASRLPRVDAVILESVYLDIARAFRTRIGADFPAWFQQLGDGVVRATERRLGLCLDDLAPVNYVSALLPAPVLFLTGTADAHASPADTQRLFDRYGGPRELVFIPDAGHRDVCAVGGERYRDQILGFLERNLTLKN